MKDIKEYITEAVYDDTAQNRKLRRVGKHFNHDKSAKEKINLKIAEIFISDTHVMIIMNFILTKNIMT